jgi:hypothetical protein
MRIEPILMSSFVASKVGLPLEVNKENITKDDFVKVKICCRDVTKVLAVVDGLLELSLL